MREQRVVLKQVAAVAALGRQVDPDLPVEPDRVAEPDPAAIGPVQAGDRAQHRGLPGARRADQCEAVSGADIEREVELEVAQPAGQTGAQGGRHRQACIPPSNGARPSSLTPSSNAAEIATRTAESASAAGKSVAKLAKIASGAVWVIP